MTTYTWTGAIAGLQTLADWSPSPPSSGFTTDDTLQFVGGATYTVSVSGTPVVVASVVLDDPGAYLDFTGAGVPLTATSFALEAGSLDLDFQGGGLDLSGSQTWAGGTVEFNGQSSLDFADPANGDSTISLGAALNIDVLGGQSSIQFGGKTGDSLTNNGQIVIGASVAATLKIEDQGAYDLGFANEGSIFVDGEGVLEQLGGNVVNDGLIELSGAGFDYVDATSFANSGLILVDGAGEFQTAHIGMSNSGSLSVNGGLAAIGGSLTDVGNGSISLSGGEVYVAGNLTGDVKFDGGELAVGAALNGTLYNFDTTDTLDLFGLAYQTSYLALSQQSSSYQSSGVGFGYYVYTYVGAGAQTLTFKLDAKGPDPFDSGYPATYYSSGIFALANDGAGGTSVRFYQINGAGAFAAHKAAIDAQTFGFSFTDSAADVSANWSALDDSHLTSITLSDPGDPLTLTAAQLAAGAGLLAKISNSYFYVQIDGVTTYHTRGGGNVALTIDDALISLDAPNPLEISGHSNTISAVSGASLTLLNTQGDWQTVYGSDLSLTLNDGTGLHSATPAALSIVGGGDVVGSGEADALSLYNTAGSWDAVTDNSASLILNGAQTSLLGGGNAVYFDKSGADAVSLYNTGGNWDTVYGSNGQIVLNSAQASIVGGGDVVYGASSSLSLWDTAGAWDAVYGSGLSLDLNAAQASLIGGGNAVWLDSSGADAISLYNTAGAWDVVYGSYAEIGLDAAQVSLVGGGDTVYLDASGADALSLYNTGANADTVEGAHAEIMLDGAQATIAGDANTIGFDAGTNAVTVSGSGETFQFGAAFGQDTIAGFNASDTIQLSASDFADMHALFAHIGQTNGNATITLGGDTITLTNVSPLSLTQAEFRLA